jgi:hypothetical protein
MSENQTATPISPSGNPTNFQPGAQPPAYFADEREQWRAERRAWREERRAARRANGAWVGGAVLIALGVIFLLQNAGLMTLHNWWALFILIPAFGSFATAYTLYRNSGDRLTYSARGSLIGGLILTFVAGAFLFELSFGVFLPMVLIIAGVGLLLNFILPS